MSDSIADSIAQATAAVRHRWDGTPRAGIILGTGLGSFARNITAEAVIDYHDIPHFPRATALGHKGHLVCGRIGDLSVVTMEGRFHRYEGYPLSQITLPVRVMHALGVQLLIVSNASGGLNPAFGSGDILVLEDHINLMFGSPLRGPHAEALGPRFPDMSRPYDPELIEQALELARRHDFPAHRGVYVALTGPNYETRAEYRFLRAIGGDVVGMSTVPEVIVAVQCGLKVLALSVVTNLCRPDRLVPASGAEVVAAAAAAESRMSQIVLGILRRQPS